MEEFLTPPSSSPESSNKNNRQPIVANRKYSTLPVDSSSLSFICNEKTNLKYGSVFSLTSLSDKSDSSSKKKNKKKSDKSVETSASISEEKPKKSPLKFKLFKKLSFSRKSKNKEDSVSEESGLKKDEEEDSNMNGKKGSKKSGKNKAKKVTSPAALDSNSGEGSSRSTTAATTAGESVYSSAASIPDVSVESSNFIEQEREVAVGAGTGTGSGSNEIREGENFDANRLSVRAQPPPHDLESTTDNEEYHDIPSEPFEEQSQVMNQGASETDVELRAELKDDANQVENSSESISASSAQTPSDIKKEILSITTPIVTETARKKQEQAPLSGGTGVSSKSSLSSSSGSSSAEKDSNTGAATSTSGAGNLPTNGTPSKNGSFYSGVNMTDKRDVLYKILVIGELGAGKTSVIKRYVHQFFSPHYRATIGVDFALKVITWDPETIIRLQLWDIAGQERFGNMTRVYYKEAVGAFIVFDVTRAATFDAVLKWKQDLDSKVQLPDGSPIPCVLLANKCDQPKEGMANNAAKIDEFVKEHNFSAWFETSAKDNINIEEAAKTLIQKILESDVSMQQNGGGTPTDGEKSVFSLNRNQKDTPNGKNCAC